MKQVNDLSAQLLNSLPTQAGKKTTGTNRSTIDTPSRPSASLSTEEKKELGQAVNGLFRLLEDAYPHRFRSAFPTDESFVRAKRVWARVLREFSPRRIMHAAEKALATSKYMPDLATIRELCQLNYAETGLKEPLQAYYEACNAHPQTRDYPWSHLAVYLAARETGWLLLQGEEQSRVLPIFERNYSILCNRVLDGEDLEATVLKGIEDGRNKALSRKAEEVADQAQRKLMADQGIDPDSGKAALQKLRETLKT